MLPWTCLHTDLFHHLSRMKYACFMIGDNGRGFKHVWFIIREVMKTLPKTIGHAQVSCLSATIRTADVFESILAQLENEK